MTDAIKTLEALHEELTQRMAALYQEAAEYPMLKEVNTDEAKNLYQQRAGVAMAIEALKAEGA